MSQKRRPDPQREQFGRQAVAAWEKSGQSVRAFCSGRGLQEASFYGWRRTLRERDRRRPGGPQPPTFVPLRVVPEPVLEVVLPTGLVVRIPPSFEAAAVATLVAALRAVAC